MTWVHVPGVVEGGVSQLLLLEKCGQKKAVGHKYMIGSLLDTEGLI